MWWAAQAGSCGGAIDVAEPLEAADGWREEAKAGKTKGVAEQDFKGTKCLEGSSLRF